MTDKEALSMWKKISSIVAIEISENIDFAKKISDIFTMNSSNGDISTYPKQKNRRAPPKIDPFALLEQGDDNLVAAMKKLTIDELKDVISANGMDTSKLAMKWKDRGRIERHIIETTKRKAAQGEAFWSSPRQSDCDTTSF